MDGHPAAAGQLIQWPAWPPGRGRGARRWAISTLSRVVFSVGRDREPVGPGGVVADQDPVEPAYPRGPGKGQVAGSTGGPSRIPDPETSAYHADDFRVKVGSFQRALTSAAGRPARGPADEGAVVPRIAERGKPRISRVLTPRSTSAAAPGHRSKPLTRRSCHRPGHLAIGVHSRSSHVTPGCEFQQPPRAVPLGVIRLKNLRPRGPVPWSVPGSPRPAPRPGIRSRPGSAAGSR